MEKIVRFINMGKKALFVHFVGKESRPGREVKDVGIVM